MKTVEVSVLSCVLSLCLSFSLGLISPLLLLHYKNQPQVTIILVVEPEQIALPSK